MKPEEISKIKAEKRSAKQKEFDRFIKKSEKARAEFKKAKEGEKAKIFIDIKNKKEDAKAKQKKEAEKAKELPKEEVVVRVDEKEEAKKRVDAHRARLKTLSKDELVFILKKHEIAVEGDKKADLIEAVYQLEIKL
tara:strand:+ start:132 stop:539 length:408 start_codon:yes stop_codon:yes gene_type:complete